MTGRTPAEFLRALACAEITYINTFAEPRNRVDFPIERSEVQHSRQAHIDLYKKFIAVAEHLVPDDKALRRPTVWHWNLIPQNIFIENGEISALTDWWRVSTAPLFMQARTPRLVKRMGKHMVELPKDYEARDEDDKTLVRRAMASTAQEWMYDHARGQMNAALQRVYDHPHSLLFRRTIAFANNTWDGDIAPFRDGLIGVAK